MATIAWLGTGRMGTPMAARLAAAGHDVRVWNRTPQRAARAVAQGARQAGTPADAAAGAELVVTMLADAEAVLDALTGPAGAAGAMDPTCTYIDMSTVGPDGVSRIAAALPAGVAMLDAPVLGSVPQATEGSLRIFVGGDPALLTRWHAVLSVLGTPRHLGPLGAGAAMKLVVNATLVDLMTALGEALALADALRLDQATVLEVLADAPIGPTVRSKRDLLEHDRYPARFTLALAAKDARLVEETAAARGVELRLARAARSWLEEAVADGLGDLDYAAVVAQVRHRPAAE